MKKLTKITPSDNDNVIWNESQKQYELSFEFCKSEYESNYIDDETLKKRIKKNSRIVYRFIVSRINQYNRPLVMAILNATEEGRNFIFELLKTQFESDVDSGYNDLTSNPAVNLANGQILPREELARNSVSVATEQEWDNSNLYFGINLGYQGQFPSYYYLFIKE